MSRFVLLLSLGFLLGTGCNKHQPVQTIALVDISGSIFPEEVDREFADMQNFAANLERGDELVIIPITGNARNDTPGHILRLTAPLTRSPFDADLIAFHKQAVVQIGTMKCLARLSPAHRTDILGTLHIAQQTQASAKTHLLIFSDFLEDDGQINFNRYPVLATPISARKFALYIGDSFLTRISFADVSLTRLRSKDSARVPQARADAIDEFWRTTLSPNAVLRFRD